MDSNNTFPTSFEQLPTEIFLQISALLSLQELVTAFFGLNSYIDSVIRCTRCASHVMKYDETHLNGILRLFPTQICRLVIVDAVNVNFTSFINLRSLTLKYGTDIQFDSIRPQYFRILEILHIYARHQLNMNYDKRPINDLFGVILSNGFSRLRICTAGRIGSLDSSETWTGSPSLRCLHLDMTTIYDYEQLLSLHVPTCVDLQVPHLYGLIRSQSERSKHVWLDTIINFDSILNYIRRNILAFHRVGIGRRLFTEINKFKQLESEGLFILDVNPIALVGTGQPPSRFNKTLTTRRRFYENDIYVIEGRILPTAEPYCRASFLIQITLPSEYPFKPPKLSFLDPIYHPNVDKWGEHCCCWGIGNSGRWSPARTITDLIRAVIDIIDGYPDSNHVRDFKLINEFRSSRAKFNKKALQYTLLYGRPRY